MNPARRVTHFTEDEYLARERVSATKHEFVDGEIFDMAGAKVRHNKIAASAIGALLRVTKGKPCSAFTGDQRIHVNTTGMYTYADAGVFCGKAQIHPKD